MTKTINNISDIRTLINPIVQHYELKISDTITLTFVTGAHADSAERGALEVRFHADGLKEDMIIDYMSPEKAKYMVKSMRDRWSWGHSLRDVAIAFHCYKKGMKNKIDEKKAPTHVYMMGWGSQEILKMIKPRIGEEECYMLFLDLGQEYFSDKLTLRDIKELAVENKYRGEIYVYVKASENRPEMLHWFVAE